VSRSPSDRRGLGADLVAGLTGALVYLPQGMAYALVAGVGPAHGLYTGMVAPWSAP
jgi:SulP family sulfate permease